MKKRTGESPTSTLSEHPAKDESVCCIQTMTSPEAATQVQVKRMLINSLRKAIYEVADRGQNLMWNGLISIERCSQLKTRLNQNNHAVVMVPMDMVDRREVIAHEETPT